MELDGLLLSDIHSGSVVSPALPKARTDLEGGTIGLNNFQKRILLPLWKEMCEQEYDFAVVNGDLVDGLNNKSKGTGLWTYDLNLQAENAANLLNLLKIKPGGKIYIVGGSQYHIGSNPGIDQLVALKLNEMNRDVVAEYCGQEFILDACKQKIHFSHWMSNAMYEGQALTKEIMFSYVNGVEIDGMIRGHRHHYWLDTDGERFAAMLPAWKGRDEYVKTYGMKYTKTQIGWVDLKLKDREWDMKPHLTRLKNEIKIKKITGKSETF